MASRRARVLTASVLVLALLTALVTRVPTRRDASAFDFNFVDVVGGSYYELAVYWMVQEGITEGTSSTTFSPDDLATRAHMAAFLYRFAGVPGNYPDHPFVDVHPGAYFNEPVKWLLHTGITTGTTPTTYSPHDPLTRGQVATFLHRLAGEPPADGAIPFMDVPVGSFFHDAVAWMYAEGITTGTSPTTFDPYRPISRAEIAALLWRFAGSPLPGGVPTTTTAGPTTSTSTTTTVFTPDLTGRPATTTTTAPPGEYVRLISIPDFFNVDVGTIESVFDPDVGVCGEVPCGDSRTDELDTSVWYILESIANDDPDAVLVAGDLVMGHWYADLYGRQVFGPTDTLEQKMAAVDVAGDVYYSQWLDRFAQRDLVVYPAVGDHELGDNDWPTGQDRSQLVDDFRAEFAEHFTQNPNGSSRYGGTLTVDDVPARPTGQWADTAYAFQLGNVLVISLDVFYQQSPNTLLTASNGTGTVIATVRDSQLSWLEQLLAGAEADDSIDHVIVQGHTPSLVPVNALASSEIYMEDLDGAKDQNTDLWQLLSQYDVPLYLAGEVHRITHSRALGVHQVVHGGIIGLVSPVNYLVIDVYPDRLELTVKELNVQNTSTEIWQTRQMIRREITIFDLDWAAGFRPTGTLSLTKSAGGSYSNSNGTGMLDCALTPGGSGAGCLN